MNFWTLALACKAKVSYWRTQFSFLSSSSLFPQMWVLNLVLVVIPSLSSQHLHNLTTFLQPCLPRTVRLFLTHLNTLIQTEPEMDLFNWAAKFWQRKSHVKYYGIWRTIHELCHFFSYFKIFFVLQIFALVSKFNFIN